MIRKQRNRIVFARIACIMMAIAAVMFGSFMQSSAEAESFRGMFVRPWFSGNISKGPAHLTLPTSSPLHQPTNLPPFRSFKLSFKSPKNPRGNVTAVSTTGSPFLLDASIIAAQLWPFNHLATATPTATATAATTCSAPTIDAKVLVIAADGKEADLPAIQQALDDLGTPYTVYTAASTPNGLTPDKLSSGCHGYYQGVILTDGDLSYNNGTSWVSALSSQEWTNLWTYESTMKVREISWYTYPTADYGYQASTAAFDSTNQPLATTLTTQGKSTFPYLNAATPVTLQYAYVYQAKALTDGLTTPLLTDAQGNALAAIHTYSDGRQVLSLTYDSNPNVLHDILLSQGLVSWVTNGLFLGERHIYLTPQIDDIFIDGEEWLPTTPCGTNVDSLTSTYRINGTDWNATSNWQTTTQKNAILAKLTLTMAFNGEGTTADSGYTPDTLTPAAIANQKQFYWISHTYDHTDLNSVDYATAASEIQQNNQVAKSPLNLTNYSTANMVTPDVSGLTNANFLQAAYDNGIRYLVTDTSVAGYNNPSPNAGIYNSSQPSILMVPRRPTNLYFNVTNPNDWVAEYNCNYSSYWGHNLTYSQILDQESQMMLINILKGDIDPYMFHQENLRAYDSKGDTLLSDLLNAVLQKYAKYYNLPLQSLMQNLLGQKVANRMQYNAAGVTASIVPGVSITLTAQKAATVPVTGLKATGAETYGGQQISPMSRLPLANLLRCH